MNAAGLIHGPQEHHLDHIAPLAILLGIPLIVTEPKLEELSAKHYPGLVTHCFAYPELGETIVREYDLIFSSLPKDLFDQIVFIPQQLHQKEVMSIWCPHGNSDKGHTSYFMEGLSKETIALVYGNKMIEFLKEKKAYAQLFSAIAIGNYRYEYYKRCASFYKVLVEEDISSKLKKRNPTVLYAPTWDDAERSSSFREAIDPLIKELPDNWNLIVKLHPNTLEQLGPHTSWPKQENLLFLKEFPSIYPLLDFCDVYLGDMSSIGYDFLTFQKPMFFLNPRGRDPETDKGLFLHQCGETIDGDFSRIFSQEQSDHYKKIQREVYAHVFGSCKNIKEKILNTYEQFLK